METMEYGFKLPGLSVHESEQLEAEKERELSVQMEHIFDRELANRLYAFRAMDSERVSFNDEVDPEVEQEIRETLKQDLYDLKEEKLQEWREEEIYRRQAELDGAEF